MRKSKIRKIGNLKFSESFIQINTIRGFKYTDKAGEIVNSYYLDDIPPKVNMVLSGLVITNPVKKITQLKITNQQIWAKFDEAGTLDEVSALFCKESRKILPILEIDTLSRIGWRNYFIHEFGSNQEPADYFSGIADIEGAKLNHLKLKLDTGSKYEATLVIEPLALESGNDIKAVLFDIDVYKSGKIEVKKIDEHLASFKEFLSRKEGFLHILNNTFRKI